jgi:3-methyladenine DNA glycosylase/8-oxoguanine DNA glycosylase
MVLSSISMAGGFGMGQSWHSGDGPSLPAVPRPHRDISFDLARRDPVMARLVEEHGPMHLPPPPRASQRFEQLARDITFQQLAGRAASTIWGRVRALVPGEFTPAAVLATPEVDLAAAGLSRAKLASIRDLATHATDGRVVLERIGRLSDDDVIAHLTAVRGIGTWTAHMFLMFTLQRVDVWPTGDLGVRIGFARAWGLDERPTPKELEVLGDPYRPWRSVVAWYCWRAADTTN